MTALGTLIGRIGNPGKLEQVGADKVKCGFTFATDHRQKATNGEWEYIPTWWVVTTWGREAEYLAPRIAKGMALTVTGQLYEEPWIKRDGTKTKTLRCKATGVVFHDQALAKENATRSPDTTAAPATTQASRSTAPASTPGDDEPPF